MEAVSPQATLVAILIAERKKAKLRQEDLAQKLGRDQTWVARLEKGKRRIDVSEFFTLADAIGFDPIRALRRVHRTRQTRQHR
jgi:transcriptional regulator with XRE-family HTH domain